MHLSICKSHVVIVVTKEARKCLCLILEILECYDPGPRVYKTLSPDVNTVNSIYAGHTLPEWPGAWQDCC